MTWIRLVLMLYVFMVAHKAACQTLSKAFLKSMKTCRGLAGAGDISHIECVGWRLLCGAPSCSEACLFFGDDLLRLWLQSVQYDLQHDIAWVTDEAYCSVVLTLLQIAFLKSVMTKDWVHGVCHSPVCQILLQIVMRAVITSSPPAPTI